MDSENQLNHGIDTGDDHESIKECHTRIPETCMLEFFKRMTYQTVQSGGNNNHTFLYDYEVVILV